MRVQKLSLVLFTLLLLLFPPTVQADGDGRLRLSATDTTLSVNQEVTVDVQVENIPTIYGADIRLTFDPNVLEVVDADEDSPGIQLHPGQFIDPEKSFILQLSADNEAGTVDYALSLLNPAPPVEGKGILVQITFRAKAEGDTPITITEGQFGTQTGEAITPALDSLNLKVEAKNNSVLDPITGPISSLLGNDDSSQNSSASTLLALGIILVIGLTGAGLLGSKLWHKRSRGAAHPDDPGQR